MSKQPIWMQSDEFLVENEPDRLRPLNTLHNTPYLKAPPDLGVFAKSQQLLLFLPNRTNFPDWTMDQVSLGSEHGLRLISLFPPEFTPMEFHPLRKCWRLASSEMKHSRVFLFMEGLGYILKVCK